jgi:beta-lactamase superfamily II metal-dependent hydrolase
MIYDGGNNNAYQSKQIYDTLINYAPDPKNVVVRAWVFSHYHGDHIGAFKNFVDRFRTNKIITIESFIFNFCNTKEQTATISPGQMPAVESAIKSYDSTIPVYKCLTGQIYRFPGMDMEILACMSDFIPQVIGYEASDADLSQGDGNTMSTVVRLLTPEGNTCMLTGDATNIVLDCMVDRYGAEYLDSDIVTTPHHAHNRDSYRARNATIKFYAAVKPEVLVVTSPNLSKFKPSGTYAYEVNVYVIKTFDPAIYKMDKISLISLSTLKEIK